MHKKSLTGRWRIITSGQLNSGDAAIGMPMADYHRVVPMILSTLIFLPVLWMETKKEV